MFIFQALIITFAAQLAPLQMPTGSVEGLVVRIGTTEPITGVDIELTRVETSAVTADATVRFVPGAPSPTIFRATTSDDGKFVLKNIPEGRYRLVATRAGGSFAPAEYGQRDPRGRGTTLELAAGQTLSGVRLSMAATGAITGRVWDADQDPVPNARVLALEAVYQDGQRTFNTVQAVFTNDFGEYRLFWLRPGRYYVAVMRQDLRAFSFAVHITTPDQFGRREDAGSPVVRERMLDDGRSIEETAVLVYFGGGTDERGALAVDVLPGTTVAAIDIPVQASIVPSRRVKGVVTSTDGQPAANAQLRLVPLQSTPHAIIPNGVTDKQGAFNIPGVVPGSYFLVAHLGASSGYSFYESLFDVGSGSSSVTRIEIGDRDLEGVAIALKPPFTLAGRVRVEGAASARWDVKQARISLTRNPNLLGLPNSQEMGGNRPARPNGTPSDDGSFVFAGLGEGDYRVGVSVIPSSAHVKAIQWGGVDVLSGGLRLDKLPASQLDILINLDGATVEGVAINERSEPVSNATVVLVPDIPSRNAVHLYRSVNSNGSGEFEIKGIAPGSYKVFVWESVPKEAWHDPEFLRSFEVYGTPVSLSDGSRQRVRITLTSQMTVRP
jgi:hypothetical protein